MDLDLYIVDVDRERKKEYRIESNLTVKIDIFSLILEQCQRLIIILFLFLLFRNFFLNSHAY